MFKIRTPNTHNTFQLPLSLCNANRIQTVETAYSNRKTANSHDDWHMVTGARPTTWSGLSDTNNIRRSGMSGRTLATGIQTLNGFSFAPCFDSTLGKECKCREIFMLERVANESVCWKITSKSTWKLTSKWHTIYLNKPIHWFMKNSQFCVYIYFFH